MDVDDDERLDMLAGELRGDGDLDVSRRGRSLLVHGEPFARIENAGLIVHLSPTRAKDLITRGVATDVLGGSDHGAWVAIADVDDWPELAREAHQWVGEPAIGRDS